MHCHEQKYSCSSHEISKVLSVPSLKNSTGRRNNDRAGGGDAMTLHWLGGLTSGLLDFYLRRSVSRKFSGGSKYKLISKDPGRRLVCQCVL